MAFLCSSWASLGTTPPHVSVQGTAQARERQRYAAGLIAAALLGHRIAGKALGGAADFEAPSASRAARKGLVRIVVMLHATRAARRVRRGGAAACGCAPVFVKARVKRVVG